MATNNMKLNSALNTGLLAALPTPTVLDHVTGMQYDGLSPKISVPPVSISPPLSAAELQRKEELHRKEEKNLVGGAVIIGVVGAFLFRHPLWGKMGNAVMRAIEKKAAQSPIDLDGSPLRVDLTKKVNSSSVSKRRKDTFPSQPKIEPNGKAPPRPTPLKSSPPEANHK